MALGVKKKQIINMHLVYSASQIIIHNSTKDPFLPPALAEVVMFLATCVLVSVCLSVFVRTLAAEPLDMTTRNLVYKFTFMISQRSSNAKVAAQRSRSQRSKMLNFSFLAYSQKMRSTFKVTGLTSKATRPRSMSEGQMFL